MLQAGTARFVVAGRGVTLQGSTRRGTEERSCVFRCSGVINFINPAARSLSAAAEAAPVLFYKYMYPFPVPDGVSVTGGFPYLLLPNRCSGVPTGRIDATSKLR